MKIHANNIEITIDEKTLKNLVNNDMDTADRHEILSVMRQIAEAFGLSDEKVILLFNKISKRQYFAAFLF